MDGCWEYHAAIDVDALDPVFLDISPPREAMKAQYGVDLLISGVPLMDAGGQRVEEFFQVDREGNRKGILLLHIGEPT